MHVSNQETEPETNLGYTVTNLGYTVRHCFKQKKGLTFLCSHYHNFGCTEWMMGTLESLCSMGQAQAGTMLGGYQLGE